MSDPISDFLTQIRNAAQSRLDRIEVPASRMRANIARILKQEGFIRQFRLVRSENRIFLRVYLKYRDQKPVIVGLERMSRPSKRRYVKHNQVPPVLSGLGVSILSTSRGIMTGKEAQDQKVGGELICSVW
jgi:small subunit ribosomal protein S8